MTSTVQTVTLDRLAAMDRFNRWLFESLDPGVGGLALEIGCGTGNLTRYLLETARVFASDVSQEYVAAVRARFAGRPGLRVARWDLGAAPPAALRRLRFDRIVCVNVLEHVEDDRAALARCRRLLAPGGRMSLLVPGWPSLYCGLDAALGHFRRYTSAMLRRAFTAAGYEVVRIRPFNLFGLLGWFWSGSVLRRRVLPEGAMRAYERLVPLFRAVERWSGPPAGLSWIVNAVAAAPR